MASKKVHRIVVLDDHETYCPVDESVVIEVTEEELQELEAGITKVKYLEGFQSRKLPLSGSPGGVNGFIPGS